MSKNIMSASATQGGHNKLCWFYNENQRFDIWFDICH